jgi:hypothetical protein
MEVVERYQLVKLFAHILMKERWEIVEKNYFWGYDILMEVVEGCQLVKLFASILIKEKWEVVETNNFIIEVIIY